jgi:hypothetical protein
MNKLTIKLTKLGNAAFDDGNKEAEIARILRELADKIEAGREPESLMDINGNLVGRVNYE